PLSVMKRPAKEATTCPSCASSTLRTTLLETGLTARACTQCGGAWIDAEAYRDWLQRRRAQPNVTEKPAAPLGLADEQPARPSPSRGPPHLRAPRRDAG